MYRCRVEWVVRVRVNGRRQEWVWGEIEVGVKEIFGIIVFFFQAEDGIRDRDG